MPTIPLIALETVCVVPIIPLRSFGFDVIAAGILQKGISTAVNTISTKIYMIQAYTILTVMLFPGTTKLAAITTQNSGPARIIHGRKRPNLLRVRSTNDPIKMSLKPSHTRPIARSAPRTAAGIIATSVRKGVIHVAHNVYAESCPRTPSACPACSFFVLMRGSSFITGAAFASDIIFPPNFTLS